MAPVLCAVLHSLADVGFPLCFEQNLIATEFLCRRMSLASFPYYRSCILFSSGSRLSRPCLLAHFTPFVPVSLWLGVLFSRWYHPSLSLPFPFRIPVLDTTQHSYEVFSSLYDERDSTSHVSTIPLTHTSNSSPPTHNEKGSAVLGQTPTRLHCSRFLTLFRFETFNIYR